MMNEADSPHDAGMGLLGLIAAVPIAIYAIRPDLLPGGFHGIDMLLTIAGFVTVQRLRTRSTRELPERVAVVLILCMIAVVVGMLLERGPNRIHDLQGVVAASTGLLNWALQWNFEAPGSYATTVQGFWIVSVVAQLAAAAGAVALLVRTSGHPRGAAIRVASVTAVLSFAYAATPGVYVPFNGYFATASRAWEFAAGCLLALASPLIGRLPSIAARSIGGVGAIGFIATCALVLPSSTTNTSWTALPSVLFSLLAIGGGRRAARSSVVGRSTRLDRWAGALTLPLALTPGLVVGLLAWVFPPIWVPGSNPMRDWTAVVCTLGVAVLVPLAARAGIRVMSGERTSRRRGQDLRVTGQADAVPNAS